MPLGYSYSERQYAMAIIENVTKVSNLLELCPSMSLDKFFGPSLLSPLFLEYC